MSVVAEPAPIVANFDHPAAPAKHPLNDAWTLWYNTPPDASVTWGDHLKELITVDSVEDFWG